MNDKESNTPADAALPDVKLPLGHDDEPVEFRTVPLSIPDLEELVEKGVLKPTPSSAPKVVFEGILSDEAIANGIKAFRTEEKITQREAGNRAGWNHKEFTKLEDAARGKTVAKARAAVQDSGYEWHVKLVKQNKD